VLSLLLVPARREIEDAGRGVEELRDGVLEIPPLLRRAPRARRLRLSLQRIVEIAADALELRRPRRQPVVLLGIQHVAHGEAERVEVVLDAQQLQRIAAVAVGQLGLQRAEAGDTRPDVPGVRDDGEQRQHQPEQQPGDGRRRVLGSGGQMTSITGGGGSPDCEHR